MPNIWTLVELLHGRRLKDNMPIISSENLVQADTRRKLLHKQVKHHTHDRKATRDLPQLKDAWLVHQVHQDQNFGCWSPATITGVAEKPRSHIIVTLNGCSVQICLNIFSPSFDCKNILQDHHCRRS